MGHESSRQHPGRCPLGCFRPSLIICSCREGMESRRDFTAAQGQGPPKPGQTACTRGHAKFMHRAPPSPHTLGFAGASKRSPNSRAPGFLPTCSFSTEAHVVHDRGKCSQSKGPLDPGPTSSATMRCLSDLLHVYADTCSDVTAFEPKTVSPHLSRAEPL